MEAYLLGGRAYGSAATQPTIAQSGYLMGVLRKHGLDKVIGRDGDLLGAVLEAGCASQLVAGLLTEDRRPWKRDEALKNAEFFDSLTDEASHAEFWGALSRLLPDFFPHGGSSSTASPTSSTRRGRKTEARPRKPRLPARPPESSTTSGLPSSPSSPSAPASA